MPASGSDYPDPEAGGEPSGDRGELHFCGLDALLDASDLGFRGAGRELCGEVVDLATEGFCLRVVHAVLIRVLDTRRKHYFCAAGVQTRICVRSRVIFLAEK